MITEIILVFVIIILWAITPAIILIVVIVVLFSWIVKNFRNADITRHSCECHSSSSSEVTTTNPASPSSNTNRPISSTSAIIRIAVDATPSRGGGLLVLPIQGLVYFYTVEWKSFFDFQKHPGPDKFELVNAMLALRLFQEYVNPYRKSYGALVLKGDNSAIFGGPGNSSGYSNRKNKPKNEKWQALRQIFYETLRNEPFNGQCVRVTKKQDVYLHLADSLSRGKYEDAKCLPDIVFKGRKTNYPLSQYDHINISEQQHEMFPYLIELQNSLHYLGPLRDYEAPQDSMWIFTSASPSRYGGILALPKQKLTYFYSMDCRKYFDFGKEPEANQLLNALLAVNIFYEYLRPYRKFYKSDTDGLILVADGSFSMLPDSAFSGRRSTKLRKFYFLVRYTLKAYPFFGRWDWLGSFIEHRYKDCGMVIAKRLCEGNYSTCPVLPSGEMFFPGNAATNVSMNDASEMEALFKIIRINLFIAESNPCSTWY